VYVLAPTTLEFFRALPVGVRILFGLNWALMAIAAAMILVLFVRPHLRLGERRVSVIRAHPLTLWLFLVCSLNWLLFMISGAMSPLISAGRYQLPLGTYRVATEDLLWFLVDGRRLYLPGALYGLASFSEDAAARLIAERMTARAKAKVSLYRARLS
jgi:hypothetical protein